ncbi:hypothetical protein J6590_060467 [Homalodisca vitripennis]|nr:hypothetical protein J6590_060467 [Homalodisca vitripennis]
MATRAAGAAKRCKCCTEVRTKHERGGGMASTGGQAGVRAWWGGGAAHAHVYRAREQRSAVPDPRNRTETLVAKQHITTDQRLPFSPAKRGN